MSLAFTRIKGLLVSFVFGFGIVSITRLPLAHAARLFEPSVNVLLYSLRCALDSALRFWQCTPLLVCVALELFLPMLDSLKKLALLFLSSTRSRIPIIRLLVPSLADSYHLRLLLFLR